MRDHIKGSDEYNHIYTLKITGLIKHLKMPDNPGMLLYILGVTLHAMNEGIRPYSMLYDFLITCKINIGIDVPSIITYKTSVL